MLYFAFELDENKIREMGYRVEAVYDCIDDAYQQLQGKLAFIKNNVRYYTRDEKDGNDFQRLWRIALGLEKQEWFIKTVKGWKFIKVSDETGKAYYAEDLIRNVRTL